MTHLLWSLLSLMLCVWSADIIVLIFILSTTDCLKINWCKLYDVEVGVKVGWTRKEEKSVWESLNGIIYLVTLHLSQSAHAHLDECHKNQAVDFPNGNLGVSKHCMHANSSMCNTCTLGQVQSDLVYYTIWRLLNMLFPPSPLPHQSPSK